MAPELWPHVRVADSPGVPPASCSVPGLNSDLQLYGYLWQSPNQYVNIIYAVYSVDGF